MKKHLARWSRRNAVTYQKWRPKGFFQGHDSLGDGTAANVQHLSRTAKVPSFYENRKCLELLTIKIHAIPLCNVRYL